MDKLESQYDVLSREKANEIDIKKLIITIWNGKILIGLIVLLSAIAAFVSLKLMPSYYRIEATIDTVSADQLRPLVPSVIGSNEYQVPAPDGKKIYDKVLLQANSLALIKAFWENKTGKALDLTSGSITEESKAFRTFFACFELSQSNPKTPEITARKISIEDKNPAEGVKLLNEFLDFLNQQIWLDQSQRMEASYIANLNALNVSYESRNLIEQRKLSDSLIWLRESLKVAESLGIKETPFRELENVQLKVLDSRDYLLGTKPLSQQVDLLVARQGKSLAPFSPELRSMENWKEQLTIDLERMKSLKGKIYLFSIVNKTEPSLDPIKPKKKLIFLTIVFISGVLGVLIVLIRSVFDGNKAQI